MKTKLKYIISIIIITLFVSVSLLSADEVKYIQIAVNGIYLTQTEDDVFFTFGKNHSMFDFPLEKENEKQIEKVFDFKKFPDINILDTDYSIKINSNEKEFVLNRINEYSIENKTILDSFPIFNFDEFSLNEIKLHFLDNQLYLMSFEVSSERFIKILNFRNLLMKFLGNVDKEFRTSNLTTLDNKLIWEDANIKVEYSFDASGFMEDGYNATLTIISKELEQKRFLYTEQVKRKLEKLFMDYYKKNIR